MREIPDLRELEPAPARRMRRPESHLSPARWVLTIVTRSRGDWSQRGSTIGQPMHRMHTRKLVAAGLALAMIVPAVRLDADEPPRREASAGITVSFVHPERQAAAVLRLFEGSRAAHPAAALVAWKHATRNPHQLGKRLEAVISFFNPEMVREWAVLHEARLELDLGATTAAPRFRLLVPRDD